MTNRQQLRIADVIAAPGRCVKMDTPIVEVIETMAREGIDRVSVVDTEGRTIGIVTHQDLIARFGDLAPPPQVGSSQLTHQVDQRVGAVLSETATGVWEYDYLADTFAWSSAVAALLGIRLDDLPVTGNEWIARLHPEDREIALNAVRAGHGSDDPIEMDLRVRRGDDSWCWVRSRGRVVERREDGWALRSNGTVTDISARKRSELLLEAQRSFGATQSANLDRDGLVRALVDSSLRLLDVDGVTIHWETASGGYDLVAHRGVPARLVEASRHLPADSPPAKILQAGITHCSCLGDDAAGDAPRLILHPTLAAARLGAIVIQPIHVDGRPVACLTAATRRLQVQNETIEALKVVVGQFELAFSRLQSEQQALENSRSFETLFDSVEDYLSIITLDGKLLRYNRAISEGLGYGDTLLGKPVLCLHPANCHADVLQRFGHMVSGHLHSCDLPLLAADGREFPAETRVTHGMWQGQQVLYCVTRDVSERLATLRELDTERTRLRTLLRTIPDLVWVKDPDGVYLDCNPRFEALYGATAQAIVGKTDSDFVSPELAAFFRQHDLAAVAAGGPKINQEWLTFSSDGHRELVETIKTPMLGADGQLIGVLGIARDVTAAQMAQAHLVAMEQRFSTIVQASPIGIAIVRIRDSCLLEVNPAVLAGSGYTRDEVLGRNPADVGLWADPAARDRFLAVLMRDGKVNALDVDIRRKDGSILNCAVSASLIEFGGERCILSNFVDLTAQRQAESAVRALQERFSVAFQASPIAISITEIDSGRFIEVNDCYANHFGWPREYLLTHTTLEIGLWADLKAHDAWITEIAAKGRTKDHLAIFLDHGGGRHWVSLSAEQIQLDGKPHVLAYAYDVTEQHLAQEALKASEQHFHSLFSNMMEGVALHRMVDDESGTATNYRIVDCNPRYEEVLGMDRQQVVDRLATDAYGTATAPYFEIFSRVARDGKPERFHSFFPPMGRHFEISAIPWEDGFATIFTDITEIHEAKHKLEEREALFAAIFNQANDSIGVVDPDDGSFVEFNEAAHVRLGYSRDEFASMGLRESLNNSV